MDNIGMLEKNMETAMVYWVFIRLHPRPAAGEFLHHSYGCSLSSKF